MHTYNTEFQSGHKPWNKGVATGLRVSINTEFKLGQVARNKFSTDKEKAICISYKELKSVDKVAALFECHRTTVYRILKRNVKNY